MLQQPRNRFFFAMVVVILDQWIRANIQFVAYLLTTFSKFSKSVGNDLSTPRPEYGF
jgi:hypothetical protein